MGLTENFNRGLKEVGYVSYAKIDPIFLFHIFKKSQKTFSFSQVIKKKKMKLMYLFLQCVSMIAKPQESCQLMEYEYV